MAFGKNNSAANDSAPPKKADIILKANQEISTKQDEIIKQTKLAYSRFDAAIEMFTKNMQDMAFIAKQSSEIYTKLQNENASLKQELLYLAKQNENIYTGLSEKIAELSDSLQKLGSEGVKTEKPASANMVTGGDIDLDYLAEKIADLVSVRDDVSPDYIASKVAEQIVIPAQDGLGYDEDKLSELISALPPKNVPGLDEEELADNIALKVGSLKAEDFEILVDDEGCSSISNEIAKNLDYEAISDKIADKLRAAAETSESEPDYDEIAARIGAKIKLSAVNEDAIAEKAAAVLSNYLPEIDTDEISDRVVTAVMESINSLPAPAVDGEAVSKAVADRLAEMRAEEDYDIVLDDDGILQIVNVVSEQFEKRTAPRLEQLETEIAEIKKLLESGINLAQNDRNPNEIATAEAVYGERDTADYNLVTVSDLVVDGQEKEDGEELLDEFDGNGEHDELMPGSILGISDGVDFENMMKYNRSFIARIIQSSDDVKNYYGSVKHALLSYKKVNSNVGWSSERFNKGRETVARLKIRGKTLCLYLALDPNEYKTSVYHQVDVSDNKSVNGTPMMVKIKSPLGVKKAIRLIDELLLKRNGERRTIPERDYAAMYPYETIEQLIEDGLVKEIGKN